MVTETEAEALLAEQQFIKRHRPRFNIRLLDDKSYPYVEVSLDEELPRVYFTRERHRPNRAYFGPFSSAKRVRRDARPARGCSGTGPARPGAGTRSGVPCLDYYIKRCRAPCVGYIDRDEYRRNIEAIMDFLSGRCREIERDLEREMSAAAEAQEFERAATYRDRLAAVRSLMQRQRIAGEVIGTADLIGVAVDGADAHAQVFQVRDGVFAERQGFYLDNRAERDEGRYERAVHRPVLLRGPVRAPAGGAGAGDARPHGSSSRRSRARRDGSVEVRVAERGDKRRLRELAERNAKLALAQDQMRRERRRQQRVDALEALADALALGSCRSGSRGSTSPTSAPSTRSPRWSCSRAGRRRRRTTASSRSGVPA